MTMRRGACGPRVGTGARLAEDDSLGDMIPWWPALAQPTIADAVATLKDGLYKLQAGQSKACLRRRDWPLQPPPSRGRCAGLYKSPRKCPALRVRPSTPLGRPEDGGQEE